MKRIVALVISILTVTLLLVSLSVYADSSDRVFDPADLLLASEERALEEHIRSLEEKCGIKFYFVSHRSDYDDYAPEKFVFDYGITETNFVLLTVVKRSYEINYYIDTWGDSESKISNKEVNYILDDTDVYDNIKYGSIFEGSLAFFTLSEKAYSGRLGASYLTITVISLIIASIISFAVCCAVYAVYKKKQRQIKYPLDKYAKLELTHSNDIFVGSYVTRRRIRRSGSSSSGGGGGGSHRGGR